MVQCMYCCCFHTRGTVIYIYTMVQKQNLSQCICSNREGLSLYAEIHLIFGIVHSALLLLLTRIFHESNPP